MFKNALLNADKKTKNDFLSSLKKVIKSIIKEENIKVTIDDMEYFDNKALYQFSVPTKSKITPAHSPTPISRISFLAISVRPL